MRRRCLVLAVSLGFAHLGVASAQPGMEARKGEQISLSGRVVMSGGTVPSEPILIEKICGSAAKVEERTNEKGYFYFTIGRNPTATMTNARAGAPVGQGSGDAFGRERKDGALVSGPSLDSLGHVDLTGCEVRAVKPGYRSSTISLGRRSVFETPEIGTIVLTPIGEAPAPTATVSATTLEAPNNARKAFEKGKKQLDKNKLGGASKQLKKAVELYPRFAEAWYYLGEARIKQNKVPEARQAFGKALEADSGFQKPYIPLALLALTEGRLQETIRLTEQVLQLNPTLAEAHFYHAMAHYSLGNSAEASASAKKVQELGATEQYPRVCIILGDAFGEKADFAAAASEYRRYIELEPDTPLASQARQRLREWESLGVLQ